jgi:hypothetical protein
MRFANKNVSRKAAAITVASALTVFGSAGAALAYWTTTGTGSGSSSVGADAGVTLSAPATAQLTPGTSDTVDITAHNGSASLLAVNTVSVTIDGHQANGSMLTSADLAALGVTAVVTNNLSQAVPNADTVVGTVKVAVANDANVNQDDLKGASFVLHFTSN